MRLENTREVWLTVQVQRGYRPGDATCTPRPVRHSLAELVRENERRLCNRQRTLAGNLVGVLGCPSSHSTNVLRGWGHTWLCNEMKVLGGTDWLLAAIATLIRVTDGSYIREHYPELCSAAFTLKCMQGGGCVTGAFPKALIDTNAFRGELLGLWAVHFLLLVVNTVSPGLTGRVRVYSDCLGALSQVAELPSYRVPSRCRHSDILKTILVNCGGLTFSKTYSHDSSIVHSLKLG
jgi:hypothetical protein